MACARNLQPPPCYKLGFLGTLNTCKYEKDKEFVKSALGVPCNESQETEWIMVVEGLQIKQRIFLQFGFLFTFHP